MRPVPSTPVLVPRVAAVSGLAVLAAMATAACGSDKGDVVGTDTTHWNGTTVGGPACDRGTTDCPSSEDTDVPAPETGDTGASSSATGETGTPGGTGHTADTANPYGSGSDAGTWPGSGSGAAVGTSPSGGSGR